MAKRTKTSKIDREISAWVNGLSGEQMNKIYQIIDPISDEERAELDKLSDDELLAALTA